jgi:hypothetical protein
MSELPGVEELEIMVIRRPIKLLPQLLPERFGPEDLLPEGCAAGLPLSRAPQHLRHLRVNRSGRWCEGRERVDLVDSHGRRDRPLPSPNATGGAITIRKTTV